MEGRRRLRRGLRAAGLGACALLAGVLALGVGAAGEEIAAPDEGAQQFGFAVALAGDRALVGAPGPTAPTAILYRRDGGSWSTAASFPGPAGSLAGADVDLTDRWAVVAAPGASSVAVHDLGAPDAALVTTLRSSTGAPVFGTDVAVDGDRVIVGSGGRAAAAEVFVTDAAGRWRPEGVLGGGQGATSVALAGDLAAVGSPGAVTVFQREAGAWREVQRLTDDTDLSFGADVALDGTTLAMGVPGAGEVRLAHRVGGRWIEEAALTSPGATGLGTAVAVDGDLVVGGAPGSLPSGSVVVFRRSAGEWRELGILRGPEGADAPAFGSAVALDGVRALASGVFGSSVAGSVAVFPDVTAGSSSAPVVDELPPPAAAVAATGALTLPSPTVASPSAATPAAPPAVLGPARSVTLGGAASSEAADDVADRTIPDDGVERRPPRIGTHLRDIASLDLSLTAITRSLLLALLLLALLAFPIEVINTTAEEHEDRVRALFAVPARWFHAPAEASKRLPPAVALIATALASAAIYRLADPSTDLGASSLATIVGVGAGLVVVSVAYDVTRGAYLRRVARVTERLRLYPELAVIALVCVVVSRAARLVPGVILGLVADYDSDDECDVRHDGRALALGGLVLLATTVASFALWSTVRPDAAADDASLALVALDAALVTVFVAGIQTLVYSLAPLRWLDGAAVRAWSRWAWAGLFGAGLFAFVHVLLHPLPGDVETATSISVRALVVIVGGLWAAALLFWSWFRFTADRSARDPDVATAPPPEPGSGQGEDLGPVVGDRDRVLEVSRQ